MLVQRFDLSSFFFSDQSNRSKGKFFLLSSSHSMLRSAILHLLPPSIVLSREPHHLHCGEWQVDKRSWRLRSMSCILPCLHFLRSRGASLTLHLQHVAVLSDDCAYVAHSADRWQVMLNASEMPGPPILPAYDCAKILSPCTC